MPVIKMAVHIQAPVQVCFDLARSIDIHMKSASQTQEKAIAGRLSGLIELNETVTWEAVHFGIKQRLTAKITEFDSPHRFVDELVSGAFQRFWHEHLFISQDNGTLMIDTFNYTSPFGIIGRAADAIFLKRYMLSFLTKRNEFVKKCAEEQVL
ncbi:MULTISPECIES: SRPBCC family protein [unclassified Paenibacillus]|uniref:SRPBCC family protein n=1 Tax=unclassified Paenibacillus TaxID=185978 RepID=UPI003638718C